MNIRILGQKDKEMIEDGAPRIVYAQCALMPNGEVVRLGKRICFVDMEKIAEARLYIDE